LTVSDVNGRAGSIELCFGDEVLLKVTGEHLPPVRWKAFDNKLEDYQGEVTMKGEIQDRILDMLKKAESDSQSLSQGARLSMELLVSHLIDPLMSSPVRNV
jgi:hypothetical protein